MEQVAFATANGQAFPVGVQGFANAQKPEPKGDNEVSPNAVRWMFNPFARINVSNRPISGHLNLNAGVFIPIMNQAEFVALPGMPFVDSLARTNGDTRQKEGLARPERVPPGYEQQTRTAYAISTELEAAYTDKGLRILPSLTGFDDVETVKALHAALVAPGLVLTPDPYQPEFPVPNLVKLEAYLRTEAAKQASELGVPIASNVVSDLLVGIRTALETCRNVTRDAKRHVANKTIGYTHTFDAYQTRCFLALGETVPSDLPFVSENGHMSAPGAPSDEVARLRAENEALKNEKYEAEIARLKAENESLKNQPAQASEVVARCDFTKDDGTNCKGFPVAGSTRCRHHVENQEDTTNGNEEER